MGDTESQIIRWNQYQSSHWRRLLQTMGVSPGMFQLTGFRHEDKGDLGYHQFSKQQELQRWRSLAPTGIHIHPWTIPMTLLFPVWTIILLLKEEGEVASHMNKQCRRWFLKGRSGSWQKRKLLAGILYSRNKEIYLCDQEICSRHSVG